MKAIKSLWLFAALLLVCSFSSTSTPPNWRFIADKTVNYGVDRDVILLGDLKDDFRQIRLRVTDAPLRMLDMKIYFDNGDVQDVRLQANFRQGEESRPIDLAGGVRHLRKIEFWYEAKGVAKGKARVAVWGKR